MAKHNAYTKEQIEFLRTGYQSMKVQDLTIAFNAEFGLNKTINQIKWTLQNHKIFCGRSGNDKLIDRHRVYKKEHLDFLQETYLKHSLAVTTEMFNAKFGMKKSPGALQGLMNKNKIYANRSGCFEKGKKSWNAGTKGQGLTGANSGSFKKGQAPPNRKPMYSERISADGGYIEIKVPERNPYTWFSSRYVKKHVWLWEQNNGPVPDGHVVTFLDSDVTNCVLENLILVSRAELLSLNRNKYKTQPDDLKPAVLALSKLQVKISTKRKEAS